MRREIHEGGAPGTRDRVPEDARPGEADAAPAARPVLGGHAAEAAHPQRGGRGFTISRRVRHEIAGSRGDTNREGGSRSLPAHAEASRQEMKATAARLAA